MKKTITENERLQLFALFTLANGYWKKLDEAEKAMKEILESESDYLDFLGDEIFEYRPDFDGALKKMGIEVK